MCPLPELLAFPSSLRSNVLETALVLSDGQLHPPSDTFAVNVRGETLEIPYRVYYREIQIISAAALPGFSGVIALCLGTRHHDGFLREKCLTRLLKIEEPWAVPFIVQLAGEYVVELVQFIEHGLPEINRSLFAEFSGINAAHLATVGRRAVSYWNVHHRHRYPALKDYPGYRVLSELRALGTRFPSGQGGHS